MNNNRHRRISSNTQDYQLTETLEPGKRVRLRATSALDLYVQPFVILLAKNQLYNSKQTQRELM